MWRTTCYSVLPLKRISSTLKAGLSSCMCVCGAILRPMISLCMNKKENVMEVQKCHSCPIRLQLLTVYFTMTWVCMSDEVKLKTFYTDVNISTLAFFSRSNHELNTPLMSHTLLSLHLHCCVSQSCLSVISLHPLILYSSIPPLSSYSPTSVSQRLLLPPSLYLSIPPLFFSFCGSIIDVRRSVSLQLDGEV